jgi:hypothetical protein
VLAVAATLPLICCSPLSLLHPVTAQWALLPPSPVGQSVALALLVPRRPPLFTARPRDVLHPPLSERPGVAASMLCWSTSPNPAPLYSVAPPRSTAPRTPTPPLPPPSLLQKEPAVAPALFSFPLPSLSSAHSHVSVTCSPPFPASSPHWQLSHCGPRRISDRRRCHFSPPPPQ